MNKLMIEMITSMTQAYQSEATKLVEIARDCAAKENYIANMTAALVLQGLARVHIAMLHEIERNMK
jgi:hypothetical protein